MADELSDLLKALDQPSSAKPGPRVVNACRARSPALQVRSLLASPLVRPFSPTAAPFPNMVRHLA